MTQNEELIFGLKRYINKTVIYLNNRDFEDFLKDDMAFDACCFCIEIISELAQKISEIKELTKKYSNINFEELGKIKDNCFKGDDINLSLMEELLVSDFPYLLGLLLMVK